MLATGVDVETTPLPGWLNPTGLPVQPSTGSATTPSMPAGLAIGSQRPATACLCRRRTGRGLWRGDSAVAGDSPEHGLARWTINFTLDIQPTAWAVLLLKKWPHYYIEAIHEAESVLRDRAILAAVGTSAMARSTARGSGRRLPTAIGTLALQDRGSEPIVTDAAAFLERQGLAEGLDDGARAVDVGADDYWTDREPRQRTGEHDAEAEAFGNASALGMAAYALECVIDEARRARRPSPEWRRYGIRAGRPSPRRARRPRPL